MNKYNKKNTNYGKAKQKQQTTTNNNTGGDVCGYFPKKRAIKHQRSTERNTVFYGSTLSYGDYQQPSSSYPPVLKLHTMPVKEKRVIAPLILRGSRELGLATGFTDKRIHERWRKAGLHYWGNGKCFFYDPIEVKTFLKKFYELQQINPKLKN